MDALNIGAAGLQAASARFEASAQRTVSGEGDLAAEIVEQVSAREQFSASAAVIRTAEDLGRRALDILA